MFDVGRSLWGNDTVSVCDMMYDVSERAARARLFREVRSGEEVAIFSIRVQI